jgi:hypothetical protein
MAREQLKAYQDCIHELLNTIEPLMVENIALRRVIADLRGPKMPDLYAQSLPDIQQNLEPLFHSLHAYLREDKPTEIRRSLAGVEKGYQERMVKAPFQTSDSQR